MVHKAGDPGGRIACLSPVGPGPEAASRKRPVGSGQSEAASRKRPVGSEKSGVASQE
ncbi:MAG: hypothetical protein ACK496_11120 [Acidobacteriota bacterium]